MFLIAARFLSVATGTPFPMALVTANSMHPTLMEGDVVAWTPTQMEDVEEGDVVVFKSYIHWPDEKLVIHRVTDIKKDGLTGKPILETKGDAHNYTDQAGPHLPEPYIREDHLMGKAVSIANYPIKMPVVGYIGIWANQGLERMAQPSSSKGPIAQLGIFAPLTITILIFVILIFVLPEKAKNAKEKIKHLILGEHTINLKKTFIIFLTAYAAFLMIIHCFAYESITASVGVEQGSVDSSMDFGRIKKGTESFSKALPLINPGVTPVKGLIFGKGEMQPYVTRKTFNLTSGKEKPISLRATTAHKSKNGSYLGKIMVYSSPFWVLYPDNFMLKVCNWNPQLSVYLLDAAAALILTSITVILLAGIAFISERYRRLAIDLSWKHTSKRIIKRKKREHWSSFKNKFKAAWRKKISWIKDITILENKKQKNKELVTKPLLASLLVIPIIFLISDKMSAMILAVLTTGLTAYFISCKIRKKLILAVLFATSMAILYMIIDSNLIILSEQYTPLTLMSLSLGVTGMYLLLLGLFIIPLSLLIWYVTYNIRNVKERKNPLLIVEGKCDL